MEHCKATGSENKLTEEQLKITLVTAVSYVMGFLVVCMAGSMEDPVFSP